ncbi:MAG: MoxR family ATPase [Deltaproteobacteria bacterium]|nr:MoxR family ATPase [Deltaproteobacteria bacterium]
MDFNEASKKSIQIVENLKLALKGKDEVCALSTAALLSGGHLLIEDVPGVGKTTLAHGIALSIDASFKRIQFTSDLLPSDVIGVTIYNQKKGEFEFRHGPIFSNVVLADEINRATPKTQSALLEAMNEKQVSVENLTYELPSPFFIVATQNPLEFAGTFPLPESQLDRFSMRLKIGYPTSEVEKEILSSASTSKASPLKAVVSGDDIAKMQEAISTVHVEEDLSNLIVEIIEATRHHDEISIGASPRGSIYLYRSAQALALIRERDFLTPDDILDVAIPVLSHRISSTLSAQTGRGQNEEVLRDILTKTKIPV